MNEVIIRILDSSNSVLGDLDLKNFNDFPLVITKGIVNLDNLKARTGSYTKSFKVPNTKNNSKLLNSLDDINSRKDYNDALNRKPCAILVDGVEIDKGFLQVSKVYQGFELDSFELVFFGNNVDWVKQASELKLNEVTYVNNTQTYTDSNILTVNASNSDTYDHCYPYISRGGNESLSDTQVRDYYPCFYLKSLIVRGLNHIGYNVNSQFLENANIEKLACDLNPKFELTESDINSTIIRAEKTTPSTTVINLGDEHRIVFNDDSTTPNKDNGSNYNNSTGVYTVPRSGRYILNVHLERFNKYSGNTLQGGELKIVENGDSTTSIGSGVIILNQNIFIPKAGVSNGSKTYNLEVDLQQGQNISIYMTTNSSTAQVSYDSGTYCTFQVKSEIVEGDSYDLNNIIPDNIKLLDVINDFTRMFNIYYWTDIKTKTIYLEPRNTFFEAETNSIDWTDKIDLSNKYEINYVSSYRRNINFKYKDVESDEFLKRWQEINKRKYASYEHTLPDRFAEGTTEISLDLFSSTYGHNAKEATPLDNGNLNEELVFTSLKIWNEYLTGGLIPDDRISSYNPRVFNFNYGTQTSEGGTSRKISFNGTEYTNIPYAVFEDYNNTTAPINLSFTGSDGLFATYYSKMLKNIEEGGRLIAYFNLDNVDIENLDFRKLVYIDYPAQVKGYYLIESVIDYNPIKNGLTKVSLFKFENLGSVSIDTTQEGNNEINIDEGNEEPTLEPIYVEDGSNLIEVWIENPYTGALYPVYK
jgi:hypothetical protein